MAAKQTNRKVSSSIETITPEQAAKLLENNIENRRISNRRVQALVRLIKEGRFVLNGDAIRVAWNGKLLDGQHRLLAIIEAGEAVRTLVVRGLDPQVFKTIDQGKQRTGGDLFYICGVSNPGVVSAAMTILLQYDNRLIVGSTGPTNTPSNLDKVDHFDKEPSIEHDVAEVVQKGIKEIVSSSVYAGLHCIFCRYDRQAARRMLAIVAGEPSRHANNPAILLRYRLMDIKREDKYKPHRMAICGLIISAWNMFMDGKTGKLEMPNSLGDLHLSTAAAKNSWHNREA